MANNLNLCQFIGRLGKDPEIKTMQNGKQVANFSIACGKSWKDANGKKQEKTEWINISAFGKLAEIIGQYVKKGDQIYIAGEMQTRKWQDQQGNDRYTTEIIANQMEMLGGRRDDGGYQPQPNQNRGSNQGPNQPQGQNKPAPGVEPDFDFDDEIPFS